MEKLFDVLCMGELIADFTCCGLSPNRYPIYEQNPGGGAANVAVSVSRLGGRAAFLGKIGGDMISLTLKEALEQENVDLSSLICDENAKNFLAFVYNDAQGERTFSFYGEHPADLDLAAKDLDYEKISRSQILSYGGRSISTPQILHTTSSAIAAGKSSGTRIAFDANIRLSLWPDEITAKRTILDHIPLCDYLKLSTEEVQFLFSGLSMPQAVEQILDMGVCLLAVSDGPNGAVVYTKDWSIIQLGYPVTAVDTTGAGDSFWGSTLFQLSHLNTKTPSKSQMQEILSYSCACGAIATTRTGAVTGMPYPSEVLALQSAIENQNF